MTNEAKQALIAELEKHVQALLKAIANASELPRLEADAHNHLVQILEDNRKYPPGGDREEYFLQSSLQRRAEERWMESAFVQLQARKALLETMDSAKGVVVRAANAIDEVRKTEYSTKSEFTLAAKRLIVLWGCLNTRVLSSILSSLDVQKLRTDVDTIVDRRYGQVLHGIRLLDAS